MNDEKNSIGGAAQGGVGKGEPVKVSLLGWSVRSLRGKREIGKEERKEDKGYTLLCITKEGGCQEAGGHGACELLSVLDLGIGNGKEIESIGPTSGSAVLGTLA